ncbi:MAG: hypothetical protein E6G59_08575 [Actinobacteria bacterium]|nr:MAG: hypothetical protein E6G59_08575 [Actinomycetota bacterium]
MPSPGGQGAGAPPTGTPPVSSTPPPAGQPSQPEIIEDYYPMVQPAKPKPPPRQRSGLGISRIILICFLVLAALGWLVRTVRHASATPADKSACTSILTAAQNGTLLGDPNMMASLSQANDKALYAAYGLMLTDFNAKNGAEFVTDLNQAINRCNQISTDFKSGFKSFCDSHPGLCKQTFHIGPF